MSYAVVDLVMESKVKDKAEFSVLLALAWRADEWGQCHPGKKRLAHEARLSFRAIPDVLTRLVNGGYVSITPGHGRSNTHQYVINLEYLKGAAHAPFSKDVKGAAPSEKVQPVPQKVQPLPIKGAAPAPEQVTEQVKNNTHSQREGAPPTLEEVLTRARMAGVPEAVATNFYWHYDAEGWKVNGRPMDKWQSKLMQWHHNEHKHEPDERKPRRSGSNPASSIDPAEAYAAIRAATRGAAG